MRVRVGNLVKVTVRVGVEVFEPVGVGVGPVGVIVPVTVTVRVGVSV